MVQKKTILLVGQEFEEQIKLEGILRVAGYLIYKTTNAATALTTYALRGSSIPIDLVITTLSTEGQLQLTEGLRRGEFERLLRIQNEVICTEIYCINGCSGCLCESSALLAAAKELLGNLGRSAQPWSNLSESSCPGDTALKIALPN